MFAETNMLLPSFKCDLDGGRSVVPKFKAWKFACRKLTRSPSKINKVVKNGWRGMIDKLVNFMSL